jgi:hypothetical protein
VSDNFNAASLEDLSSLGSCPSATPENGWLSYDGMEDILVSLDGEQSAGTLSGGGGSPTIYELGFRLEDQEAFVLIRTDPRSVLGGEPVSVERGVLVLLPTAEHPLRVSCLGLGATAGTDGSGQLPWIEAPHLESSRTCPGEPVEGALGVGIAPYP